MSNRNKKRQSPESPPRHSGPASRVDDDNPIEKENAVEWGERLHSGKMIARGGKSSGFVRGATEQSTD
jgi:hypothetical protein